jgi:CheY-like chemotaxis protein
MSDIPQILIVEENLDLLDLLVQCLEPRYRVFPTTNGRQALSILTRVPHLDLVVCDSPMPLIAGRSFSAVLRSSHPDVPFLLLAPGGKHPPSHLAQENLLLEVIKKPVSFEKLLDRIDELLLKETHS